MKNKNHPVIASSVGGNMLLMEDYSNLNSRRPHRVPLLSIKDRTEKKEGLIKDYYGISNKVAGECVSV